MALVGSDGQRAGRRLPIFSAAGGPVRDMLDKTKSGATLQDSQQKHHRPRARAARGSPRAWPAAGAEEEMRMANVKPKSSLPRVLSLFVALIGCIITAVPFAFGVGGDPAPIILVGSGVTVIALGLFLFFSI
jgi:hypothetical protein